MSPALRLFAGLAAAVVPLGAVRAADKPAVAAKPIDLVLCLDVSGSMNGLIDSAKLKLWDIVNEMARLKPTPDLRVALYSYGHDSYPADSGWVRKEVDLTADLDGVYKALNGLRINGGTELVARVSQTALAEQEWSRADGALKIMFVCGNESADQDRQVSHDAVAEQAKKAGVIVNTIFCGSPRHREAGGYADFARKCGGKSIAIDQNQAARQVAVKTEFDADILTFNAKLNSTYVAYGKAGRDKAANQLEQDRNADAAPAGPGGAPAAALGRAASKAGALYRNQDWDLVDRMREDKEFDLKTLPADDLPEEMKKLTPEERVAYVQKKAAERAELQKTIADLSAKRQKAVDAEQAKQPKTDAQQVLDAAVKAVVREQAKAKGFE